ncbi:MAG: hypothetical protein WC342_08740 [Methanoregula sp.]|jgi:hypothetical protein
MNAGVGKILGTALILMLMVIVPVAAVSVSFSTSYPQTLAKGDHFTVNGTGAENGTVALWVIGSNYFGRTAIPVVSGGTFSCSLDPSETRNFSSGQYAFIIQDPGSNRNFEIGASMYGESNITLTDQGNVYADIGPAANFRASVRAEVDRITSSVNRSGVDDSFAPYYFFIEEPAVHFDNAQGSVLENVTYGAPMVISGTTNMGAENPLDVRILSADTMQPVYSGTIAILPGSRENTWQFEVGPETIPPGDYFVTVGWQKSNTTGNGMAQVKIVEAPVKDSVGTFGLALVIVGILAVIGLVWWGVSRKKVQKE